MRRRPAEAARAPGEGQVRPAVRPKRTYRPSVTSVKRRCSICSAPNRGCRISSFGRPRPAWSTSFRTSDRVRCSAASRSSRTGDRAWPGAAILELPDLSSVHLEARLDESDRGRLQRNQEATVRIEAVPGTDFKARLDSISVLAKVDFTSGWPPAKNFDLNLVFLDVDSRMRPGMTAVARIATQRVPDVVLVPAEAIFQRDGAPIVYKLDGSMFVETPVTIRKRGKEQAIVDQGVQAGDRIATRRPQPEMIRRNE